MVGLARPLQIQVHRNEDMLDLVIDDVGVLTMPRDAAHDLSRQLMATIAEVDRECPRLILPGAG